MRKITLHLLAGLLVMSALATAEDAGNKADQEHHSRFSKLAVWRHHKDADKAKVKSHAPSSASQAAVRPQPTVAAARPVKHFSDMDNTRPEPAKRAVKTAAVQGHSQNAAAPVKPAAKKEVAGKKPHKKSGKPAAGKGDKKPA